MNSWTPRNNDSTQISIDLTAARYSNYDDNTGSIMEGGGDDILHTRTELSEESDSRRAAP